MSNLATIFGAGFDANSVEPQGDFEVLPPGKYPVTINESEVKQTKKQDGFYLSLTMTVLDGEYRGRKLWPKIQIQNPSQKCVEIGRRTLSALGRATGVLYVSDENQFLGKTCMAHVKVKDEQNEIRTYSTMSAPIANPGPYQERQYEQAAGRAERQPVVPIQMQPPMQSSAVQSPVAPQGAAVGPVSHAVAAGTPPWQR